MSSEDHQAFHADTAGRAGALHDLPLTRPILAPLVLLFIAVLLRILDIFFLGLAEAVGEAFLHKALGFILVLLYLWAVGRSMGAIGLHGRFAGRAMAIGASGALLTLIAGYGLQWFVSDAAGNRPECVITAIDPQTGLAGGLGLALVLLAGNVINSSMEESLFRGVMLTHFRTRISLWQANLLQAVVFGLWHLAWPARRLVAGQVDASAATSQAAVIVVAATISGLAYGYLYLKTDNLWAPWLAHAINNSVFNLVHIRTIEGLDAETGVLYPVVALGCVAMLMWTKLWAKRLHLPELRPWDASQVARTPA
jgi:membrane protease YdiL (CAAX protease family)